MYMCVNIEKVEVNKVLFLRIVCRIIQHHNRCSLSEFTCGFLITKEEES